MGPARALLVALVTGVAAACGGGGADGAGATCDDTTRGRGATFATADDLRGRRPALASRLDTALGQ